MISRGKSAPFASKKNPYISKLKYTISYKAEGSGQAGTANDLIHSYSSIYKLSYNSGS